MQNCRTDLALESREIYRKNIDEKDEAPGVVVEEADIDGAVITRVKIVSKEGENALCKPMGSYVTIEIPQLHREYHERYEQTCKLLSDEVAALTNLPKGAVVLVVGLGNRYITADSLGPKTVEKLMTTRHLIEQIPDQLDECIRPVCALAPGVLGITGIETVEIVKGVAQRVKPDLIIAIDALAARRIDRINTTIQLSDTGISPGSGVGNRRQGLDKKSLGVPVIAIGVPTVVDAATMANDTIDLVVDAIKNQAGSGSAVIDILRQLDDNSKFSLIQGVLSPYVGDLTVTTKEVDSVMDRMSKVLAGGMNMAFHNGITLQEAESYLV